MCGTKQITVVCQSDTVKYVQHIERNLQEKFQVEKKFIMCVPKQGPLVLLSSERHTSNLTKKYLTK